MYAIKLVAVGYDIQLATLVYYISAIKHRCCALCWSLVVDRIYYGKVLLTCLYVYIASHAYILHAHSGYLHNMNFYSSTFWLESQLCLVLTHGIGMQASYPIHYLCYSVSVSGISVKEFLPCCLLCFLLSSLVASLSPITKLSILSVFITLWSTGW